MSKSMAEVLAEHLLVDDDACDCDEMFYDTRLTAQQIKVEHSMHVEERLSAAGFGVVPVDSNGPATVLVDRPATGTDEQLHARIKSFLDKNYPCCGVAGCSGEEEEAAAIMDLVTAAGFGLVADAASAALRSVDDIWGSVGRSTVRLSEIREASHKVLAGDWDNHLRWNLADIAKERIRAAVRGEG